MTHFYGIFYFLADIVMASEATDYILSRYLS